MAAVNGGLLSGAQSDDIAARARSCPDASRKLHSGEGCREVPLGAVAAASYSGVLYALVAQWIERLPRKLQVGGSIPSGGTPPHLP